MAEKPVDDRLRFSLRTMLLWVAGISVLLGGLNALRLSLIAPRVNVRDVQQFLRESVKIGMPRQEVQARLRDRYEVQVEFDGGHGQSCVDFWIKNSGPQSPFALIPQDIRVELTFDGHDRLTAGQAVSEDRF